jgi:5'-3' exonuclease
MGVLRFFRHLLNSYKNFYRTIASTNPSTFDVVLIDLNAIFHPACREVYNPPFKTFVLQAIPEAQKELLAFQKITDTIEQILSMCKPTKVLYLAIDGVAGACKQSQQRKRRFVSAKIKPEKDWDTAHITCGTPWMARLCKYLHEWILVKKHTLLANVKVIYSDMYVESEGEHKLIRYLDATSNFHTRYCIMSPDADLIMLCLCLPKGHGYILRENIYTDVAGKFLLVNCDSLKQQVSTNIAWTSEKDTFVSERAVKDYVLFLMTIGNDFLPNLYCLEIGNEGIETLQKSYIAAASECGYLVNSVCAINKETFTKLFEHLATHEASLILKKFKKGSKFPDYLLASHVHADTLDFDGLRADYYKSKFKEMDWSVEKFQENIREICKAYLRGLNFVIGYYTTKIPSYDWAYEFHYAPFMKDMYEYVLSLSMTEWNDLQHFDFKQSLTLNQALLGIISPRSFEVLPASIQHLLLKNKDHPLFKDDFEVDYQGKAMDYEGVCLLPNVPYETLKVICKDKYLKNDPIVFG